MLSLFQITSLESMAMGYFQIKKVGSTSKLGKFECMASFPRHAPKMPIFSCLKFDRISQEANTTQNQGV